MNQIQMYRSTLVASLRYWPTSDAIYSTKIVNSQYQIQCYLLINVSYYSIRGRTS